MLKNISASLPKIAFRTRTDLAGQKFIVIKVNAFSRLWCWQTGI